jgi:hypothetical protein
MKLTLPQEGQLKERYMYLPPSKQPLLLSSRTFLVLAQLLALDIKINLDNETYYRQSHPKQHLIRG